MKTRWLITGVPRGGKTILAGSLAKRAGLNHIHVDSLVDTFEKIVPEVGISHDGESHAQVATALRPFLFYWLERQCFYEIPFVADSYHVLIEDLPGLRDRLHIEPIYVGYPNIEPAAKLELVRKYSPAYDWTKSVPDHELLDFLARCRERCQAAEELCAKLKVRFIDTSREFSGTIQKALGELSGC